MCDRVRSTTSGVRAELRLLDIVVGVVPLAHQSALAGVLLAAGLARSVIGRDPHATTITRVNVLRELGQDLSQTARRGDGRCLCDDRDFVHRYSAKWSV